MHLVLAIPQSWVVERVEELGLRHVEGALDWWAHVRFDDFDVVEFLEALLEVGVHGFYLEWITLALVIGDEVVFTQLNSRELVRWCIALNLLRELYLVVLRSLVDLKLKGLEMWLHDLTFRPGTARSLGLVEWRGRYLVELILSPREDVGMAVDLLAIHFTVAATCFHHTQIRFPSI